MIWQAPWAWLGLITVALPILIHLLGRGKARRLPFPSLQFFGATRPLPTSRTRLHDLLLLAVRVAILIAAVAALAQPLLLTARRRGTFDASLARAVIVDTSASMQRKTSAGEKAIDAALRTSQSLADSATTGIVLRTASPGEALAGATAWLNRQAVRSELVVVSDFQLGTLDSTDLAAVPRNIGVRLASIHVTGGDTAITRRSRHGAQDVTAQLAFSGARTSIAWATQSAAAEPEIVITSGGPADARELEIQREATATTGLPVVSDTAHRIAIVYLESPERATWLKRMRPIDRPWMAAALRRMHGTLASWQFAAAPAETSGSLVVVDRGWENKPLMMAGEASVAGRDVLVLFPLVPSRTASLVAAATRALAGREPDSELDPATLSDSTLAAWQRPAAVRELSGPPTGASDGRWFWLAALILLGVETYLRRGIPRAATRDIAPDAAS